MRVAVLTLTRDRLEYTKHCFAALQEHAGCDYDHYVFDQGSEDDTVDWLLGSDWHGSLTVWGENAGIARGMNLLHDQVAREKPYDVVVKIDNDLEMTQANTLRDLCQIVLDTGFVLSPRILGLLNPPQPTREIAVYGETILDVPQIGGICLAAPSALYDSYRYPEDLPKWGMDDVHICAYVREHGGMCGYVNRLEAWHYKTTAGQREDQPMYFARKDMEYVS